MAGYDPSVRAMTSAALLYVEACTVAGLRLMKLAAGGAAANAELQRMVSEKAAALAAAQIAVAASLFTGKGHLGPARAVAVYRRRVRANRNRLSRRRR
jgi:hypothetical protein